LGRNSKLCLFLQAEITKTASIMANTATMPAERQLIVDVEDMSLFNDIKKAISMLRGVGKVSRPRRKRMTSYELSLRELDEGKVYKYDSLEDFIKEMER
jgi:hypothetical protein